MKCMLLDIPHGRRDPKRVLQRNTRSVACNEVESEVPMAGAGRVAVVTGGAAGIGRSIAARLAKDGFKVAIIDAAEGGAEDAAKQIANAGGVAAGFHADVSDREQVDA